MTLQITANGDVLYKQAQCPVSLKDVSSNPTVTTQFGTAGCVCARHSQKLLSSAVLLTPPPPLLFMLLYIHFHYSNNCFWIRRFAIAKGKIIITIMKFILRTRSSKLHVGHRIKEYQCLNPHQALLWSTLLSSLPHTVCHTQKLPVHWALKGAWLSWGQPRPLHTSKGY